MRFLSHRMIPATALLMSAGLTVAASAPTSGRVSIALPEVAEVTGTRVSLGDIAALSGDDLATVRLLDALPLGPAPGSGATVLERDTLVRWIRARAGIAAERIVWQGATRTEVRSSGAMLTGENVAREARKALEDWLGRHGSRIEVQAASLPRDQVLPGGRVSLRPRPIGEAAPRKRMLVWVDAFVDERFVRAIPVSFDVSVYAVLPTATANLPAGATLAGNDVVLAEVDAIGLPGHVASLVANGQQRLRRPVRAGEALTERHLEAVPAVARGETAVVRLSAGAVTLEGRVEVLQDGQVGQLVRVRQSGGAGGSVLARVVAAGQVEIAQ